MTSSRERSLTADKFVRDMRFLTACETLTGNITQIHKAFGFIVEQLDTSAWHTVIQRRNDKMEAPILLAGNTNTKTPDVCYLVHVDVVPALPHQFSMLHKGDFIYGRGVSDMKFSIPIGYGVLNDLMRNQSETSFVLAVTSDEERGGFLGAKYLATEYGLNPKVLIVPDGGDNFNLIDRSKAVFQVEVTATGKTAHSSKPWLGESALNSLIKLASRILDVYEENGRTETWDTTVNIGTFSGGNATNQVAGNAQMSLDFRFPHDLNSLEQLEKQIMEMAIDVSSNLQVRIKATGEHSVTNIHHPALQEFLAIMKDQLEREVVIKGAHGSSDVRHFTHLGVPYIMTKPQGGDIHGDNEHISVSSSLLFYEMVLQFLSRYKT